MWIITVLFCCVQLSKIIKHLQAQLDHQEAVGASLEGQLAAAQGELRSLQALEANQQEAIEQAMHLTLCLNYLQEAKHNMCCRVCKSFSCMCRSRHPH